MIGTPRLVELPETRPKVMTGFSPPAQTNRRDRTAPVGAVVLEEEEAGIGEGQARSGRCSSQPFRESFAHMQRLDAVGGGKPDA